MEKELEQAIFVLKEGGVVAFPTDTVYGLGANPFISTAVARVFAIKGRPSGQALPLLLSEASQMERLARDIPDTAWELARRFWPGALTLVLKKALHLRSLAVPGDTVALRLPDHPIPRILAAALGAPITGTSANRSGRPSPLDAQEVRRELGREVDFVLEGGPPPGGKESTILDLSGGEVEALRLGAISLEEIEKVCTVAAHSVTL